MGLHRSHADDQPRSNLAIWHAIRYQAQHIHLALAQGLDQRCLGLSFFPCFSKSSQDRLNISLKLAALRLQPLKQRLHKRTLINEGADKALGLRLF